MTLDPLIFRRLTMKIISAEERLKQQTGVKMSIFGQYGVGSASCKTEMA